MQKHKPPSRIRYERTHPTISFRLDREMKERLEKVLKGQSFANFVKEALGVREREEKSIKNNHEKGYNEGFAEGYEKAMGIFGVYTTCAICGERIIIQNPKEKRAIDSFLRSQRWCHTSCMDAMQRGKYRW